MCGRRDEEEVRRKRLLTEKWLPLLLGLCRVVCSTPWSLSDGHSGSADGSGTSPGWSMEKAVGVSAAAHVRAPKIMRPGYVERISNGTGTYGDETSRHGEEPKRDSSVRGTAPMRHKSQ